jgi:hypothetical protein
VRGESRHDALGRAAGVADMVSYVTRAGTSRTVVLCCAGRPIPDRVEPLFAPTPQRAAFLDPCSQPAIRNLAQPDRFLRYGVLVELAEACRLCLFRWRFRSACQITTAVRMFT